MLISPAASRKFNYCLTYWPFILWHSNEERPTEIPSQGIELRYRLQGLLMFLMFGYLAGEVLHVVVSRNGEPQAVPTHLPPQSNNANDPWPQIFMGLIFVSIAFRLLLKPETVHHWALERLGKLRKEPTKKEILFTSGILALSFLAFGLYIIWVSLKCNIIACR